MAVLSLTAPNGATSLFGKAGANALSEVLARTGAFEIVPLDAVEKATQALGGQAGVSQLGTALRADRILKGDVSVETAWRGDARWARSTIRVFLFASDTGLCIGGGWARGTARADGAWSDEELVALALRRASEDAVSRLLASPRTATIVDVSNARWTIDKGFADGFRSGVRVDVMQGDVVRAQARVGPSEAHRADLYVAGTYGSAAPGNQAVGEFMASELPKDRHAKEWIDPRTQVQWGVARFSGVGTMQARWIAANALTDALGADRRWRTVSPSLIAFAGYGLDPHGGETGWVRRLLLAQQLEVPTLALGEMLACEVVGTRRGRKATVEARILAYDVLSGYPIGGVRARGSFEGRDEDGALFRKAIEKASSVAVGALRRRRVPRATVTSRAGEFYKIDQGSRAGFKTGDRLAVMLGRFSLGVGAVGTVSRDAAEFRMMGRDPGMVAPGARVWVLFDPATLGARR